jgi:predicted dehydrogenase
VLSNLFGPIASVSAHCITHIPRRVDEEGRSYEATADDAVYALFTMQSGVIVQLNSSWATRVYRDDLFTLQVDGTNGSAIAGLRDCKTQARSQTPRAVWNPDLPVGHDYFAGWQKVDDGQKYENAFKAQWELFLRHVLEDAPFPYDFLAGAKGVQLAELGEASSAAQRRLAIPEMTLA